MKRTALVLSAMLFATYSVADDTASVNSASNLTLAAVETTHQARWTTAPAKPAARVEQPSPALADKSAELNNAVNSQLEKRLAEKMNIEFDVNF